MPVSGVIFDCDGTLLDSTGAWVAVQNLLAARAGAQVSDEEESLLCSLTIPETGLFFHDRFGVGTSGEDVVGMIEGFMHEYYQTKAVARAGALEFVKALVEREVKCCVASSTPQALLRVGLEQTGFSPYLEAVVSVDDVGVSKREPAVYDYTRKQMGTPKESTWVFEDSVYAVRTLVKAGYPTVAVYDRDMSGTLEELAIADLLITGYDQINAESFVQTSRKLN